MDFWTITFKLLEGFWVTCEIFLVTLVASIPLGLLISFGSMSKIKPIRATIKSIVWVIRGIPLMLLVIAVYYGPALLFGWGLLPRIIAVLLAFIINYACYFSEIFRAGIESIPQGQYEAGPDNVITLDTALKSLYEQQKTLIDENTENGEYLGEIFVKLSVINKKAYYYVALIETSAKTALLIDGETGELLAIKDLPKP